MMPPMPLAVFGPLDWGVVLAYFALVTFVGLAVARKDQDEKEYFLGNRSMPAWAVAISIVATMLSAATFVSVPDNAFAGDLSYLILTTGGILAVVIVALVFVPRLYRAGTVTIYGYLAQRFGESARVAMSCAFIFGRMLGSGARLFLAAIPLCLLIFGFRQPQSAGPYTPTLTQLIIAITVITAVGTFYTTMGGVRAVVWVDCIQFAIVMGAAFLTIGILLHRIPLSPGQIVHLLATSPSDNPGGHSKLFLVDTSLNFQKPYTLWAGIFGAVFLHTAAYGVDQDLAQRFLVSKSVVRGGFSVIISQVIAIATITIFLFIGMLLYIFYKRPEVMHQTHAYPGQQGLSVYPWFLLTELPTVLSGISIAGFFAVAQGSMDSAMNALASSIVADLYVPMRRRMGQDVSDVTSGEASKVTVALVGLVLCLFAIFCAMVYNPKSQTLLDFALGVLTFAFAGMLGVFLTALLTNRGSSGSVIAALIAGVLTVVLLQDPILGWWSGRLFHAHWKLAWPWWMPIGTAVSFAVCQLGSTKRLPAANGFPATPPAAQMPIPNNRTDELVRE
jgi:solute:Na+ symporter, SSS family